MTFVRALSSILFVGIVIGLALAAIFWPLLRYEQAMQNQNAYRVLIKAWVGSCLALTIFLCRRDILALIRRN
ncbi:MAG: hypothetical protein V3U22_04220 [Vicinamibacteria bacterium]